MISDFYADLIEMEMRAERLHGHLKGEGKESTPGGGYGFSG
jgi:hypothetical protein